MASVSSQPAGRVASRRVIASGAGRWSQRILAASALVSASWLAAPGMAAGSDPTPRLGLTPVGGGGAHFELTLHPAEALQLQVEAANFGADETVARTYAADVYSIVNGGFGAELFGQDASGTASWLAYPTSQLSLGPGEATIVTFRITVPAGTKAGQYIAALVIENAEPVRGSGPVALNLVNRNAIAVAIDVPGPRDPALAIGGVAHKSVLGSSLLIFDVSNPGNTHLRPTGAFRLLDSGGSQVRAGAVAMDAVYAGTRTRLEAPLLDPLPPGDYCAELTLTDLVTGASATTECIALTTAPAMPDPDAPDATGVGPPGRLPGTYLDLTPGRISLLLILGAGLVCAALLLAAWRRRQRSSAVPGDHSWTPVGEEDA